MSTHANMVKMTVTSVGADPYTITLNAASSGFQSFADAYGGNATVDILITQGTTWEVARDCTYTHSGTTVTRGTLEDSSTGSRITTFDNTAVVSLTSTAHMGNRTEAALQAVTPGGRLTLESGVPVSTTDQTAKTSIYYTPFVHNIINLWDGSAWVPISFTEYTLALGTLTSGKPYDVFAYLNSGALALEVLVWTNDTSRATAITLQDGRYCKSGDKTRLLLGTFYTTSTTTTADTERQRLVNNLYNTLVRSLTLEVVASHTYSTATRRYWNNDSANRFDIVACLATPITVRGQNDMTGTVGGRFEVNANDITTSSPTTGMVIVAASAVSGNSYQQPAVGVFVLPAGFNFVAAVEIVTSSTCTYDYLSMVGGVAC